MKKIFLVIAIMACCLARFGATAQQAAFTPDQKIRIVEQIVERFYVDSVNPDAMVEEGIRAMLRTLDPHSQYSDAEETKALTEPLEGNFSGIGIQFNMLTDTLYVIATVAGGPSERVGILAGDRIMSVNDTLIAGVKKPTADVMRMLRGPKGSEVEVKVKRGSDPDLITFRITRDDIPINSVDAYYMAAPKVGYVRISRFAESTADEVIDALNALRKQGMRDLIIDLEDNGGGYLNAAIQLASLLLPKDAPIVFTEGMRQEPMHYNNTVDGQLQKGRVVVMVNQYSASASEILSGAIQDNDRGLIVGRRTFGKGLVQRPFPLPDGSMVRLTTAHYYTPSGRSIQKPYTRGDESDAYARDILDRLNSGELMNADSVHFSEKDLHHTLRLNRPVYGGGGIMPDRFVPLDTSFYTTYYRDLVAKGVLNRYSQGYVDANRASLRKQYPGVEKFIKGFEVTDGMMDSLVALGVREGVEADEKSLGISGSYIRTIIKALIARDLYDQTAYYRVTNEIDPVYAEALRLITDPKAYRSLLPAE